MKKIRNWTKSLLSILLVFTFLISNNAFAECANALGMKQESTGTGLYINGTEAPLTGTGYEYDKNTKTLKLNGYIAEGNVTGVNGIKATIYVEDELILEMAGDNALENGGDYGIYCKGNLTLKGEGSLAVAGTRAGVKIEATTPTVKTEGDVVTSFKGGSYGIVNEDNMAVLEIAGKGSFEAYALADNGCALVGFNRYIYPENVLLKTGSNRETAQEIVDNKYKGEKYVKASMEGLIVEFVDRNSVCKRIRVTEGSLYKDFPSAPNRAAEGYGFLGWFAANGNEVKEGETVTADLYENYKLTLTAKWEPLKYKVTLVSDATGTLPAEFIWVDVENKYNALEPAVPKNAETYEFVGWYTTDKTGGVEIKKTSNLVKCADHTLYARWDEIGYTLTYDTNGGDGLTPNNKKIYYNKKYGTLPTPTRKGYAFDGWYTAATGGSKVTQDTVHNKKADVTIYAHWTIKNKCIVTLNANGGKFGTIKTTETVEVFYGDAYGSLPTPERDGYTFLGYYTDATGGTLVSSTTIVTKTTAHTLYAHWEETYYRVTLEPNGGEVKPNVIKVKAQATYGDNDYSKGKLPEPTKIGHNFEGWYTENTFITKVNASDKLKVQGNHTLYAKWTANKYEVRFDANGGTATLDKKTVTAGEKYGDLPEATKEGYTFAGWYTEKEAGTLITKDTIVKIGANQILYAHWKGIEVVVTFKAMGGTVATSTKRVNLGEKYGVLPTPVRAGYVFKGWYTAASGGEEITADSKVVEDKDHPLYAHWSGESNLVIFDANGGDAESVSKSVTNGKTYGTLPNATRRYYSFLGWYTQKTGGKKVTSSTSVFLTGEQILYAHWKKIVSGDVEQVKIYSRKGGFKVTFEKPSYASGCLIKYSTSSSMKNAKYITTKNETYTKTGLRNKKVYYVQVRSFRYDSTGKRVYGKWSVVKKIKTK